MGRALRTGTLFLFLRRSHVTLIKPFVLFPGIKGRDVFAFFFVVISVDEHLLKLIDRIVEGVFLGGVKIVAFHGLELLGMLKEPVDSLAEVFDGTVFEETMLFIDGELFGRAHGVVGNEGDGPAGDGFHGRDAFDFVIGSVDVKIDVIEDLAEFFVRAESDMKRIGEFLAFGQGKIGFLVRPLSAEDDLNVFVMFGRSDGFDDEVLPFLVGEAPGHADDEFAFVFLGPLHVDLLEEGDDPIGDDPGFAMLEGMVLHDVGRHLGGAVDIFDLVPKVVLEREKQNPVDELRPAKMDGPGRVLGDDVHGARDGDALLLGEKTADVGKLKGQEGMDDVLAFDGFFNRLVDHLAKQETVFDDGFVGKRHRVFGQAVITVIGFPHDAVAADDGDFVASLFKLVGKAQAGSGSPVGHLVRAF